VPVVMEYPFTVPLASREKGERPIKIGGKIDRVDMLPEGIIEVVDYKTGATIPSQKEVDRNLQLSFYALAATRIPYEPYGKKPGDVKLSLYYLDSQEKISSKRSAKQLEDAVDEIFEARKEIENSEFRCSGHMFCQNNCEYSLFCKSDQES
jgi:RecB family exonuclease